VFSLAHSILQLFDSVLDRYEAATFNHHPAMAPKSRAIPIDEWERHKDVIRDLFGQKNLAEVIEEMKRSHDFDAT
jgi:hypothetical protein